jgi:glycosyltransferase involved in cell wall biosynthesis
VLDRIGRRLCERIARRSAALLSLPRSPHLGRLRALGRSALGRRDVVLIHLSGVANRARVLKIGQSLLDAGLSIAFMSKLSPRHRGRAVRVGRALGCPVLYFPDAHAFLPGPKDRVPGLNWPLMVQYLKAAMWTHVRAIGPRVIHTFDAAAIGLGHDFRDRLRAEGKGTAWFHDFPEYTAGHRFADSGAVGAPEDAEWRRVVLEHEALHARHPDHAFAVSPALAAALAEDYGLDPAPTALLNVPRAIDFDPASRLTVRRALGVAEKTPLLVYSGGLTPHRGIDTLVAALALMPEAHLVLLARSRSPYLRSLIDRARATGCGGRLHVHPFVEPARISSFLRDATLGVHPLRRYGNAEVALPNKLFDYLHAGLPVVVSDCRAMADFVRAHGVGRVFAADDAGSLVDALRRVLAEREALVARVAASAIRGAYCWEREEAVLIDIYRRHLGRARAETA